MGKNTFTSYEDVCRRLAELERKNAELENKYEDLKEENRQLKLGNFGHERLIMRDITHTDKAKKLFAVAARNGEVVNDAKTIRANFSVFYQNVFRALQPACREHKGNYSLKMRNVGDLTEEEYKIYLDTLDACIETIYYAKQKLQKGEKENG